MIEVVLDTETTGLSVKEGHRIVEIGCIELDDLVPTKKKFHTYLNPERKVSESAFKVHGYSNEFLSSKKKFIDIADDFLSFIKDKKIVIHNAEFDISHINNELKIAGLEIIKKDIVIDTLELARNKFPGSSVSLDALCKRFRIDNSKREKHNAILDCELLSKVYVNLLDQKEPSLNFLNSDRNEVKEKNNKSIKYSNKIVNITEEDLKLHEKFIKTHLKKNFF
tara:strand:- start:3190 stop:3858 length:669 start_codon:yes stop_codon:yes gene_type:complete